MNKNTKENSFKEVVDFFLSDIYNEVLVNLELNTNPAKISKE